MYVLELKKTLNSATCGCKLVAKPEKRRGKALWAEESDDGPPLKERVRYRRYAKRKGKPCREKIQRERQRVCVLFTTAFKSHAHHTSLRADRYG
ncbi:hypothetical protein CSPX01_07357 [Colletotrichum filicis]|nr:hypothetical protein CSPX01_07357 [Colletotrichum filicis]